MNYAVKINIASNPAFLLLVGNTSSRAFWKGCAVYAIRRVPRPPLKKPTSHGMLLKGKYLQVQVESPKTEGEDCGWELHLASRRHSWILCPELSSREFLNKPTVATVSTGYFNVLLFYEIKNNFIKICFLNYENQTMERCSDCGCYYTRIICSCFHIVWDIYVTRKISYQ